MSFRASVGCIKTQQPHKQAATCMTYLFDMQVAYQQHAPFLSINISTKPIMAINKIARNSSKFRVIFTVPDFCWAPSCSACRTSMLTVKRGCITTSSGIMSLMPGGLLIRMIGLLGGENLYGFAPNAQN